MKMKDEATELPKCVFNVQDAEYKYMQALFYPQKLRIKIFNTQSGHKRQRCITVPCFLTCRGFYRTQKNKQLCWH